MLDWLDYIFTFFYIFCHRRALDFVLSTDGHWAAEYIEFADSFTKLFSQVHLFLTIQKTVTHAVRMSLFCTIKSQTLKGFLKSAHQT